MKLDMVNRETVEKAANDAGLKYTFENYEHALGVYEAGMIDILREVAVKKMLEWELEAGNHYSDDHRQLVEKHAAAFNEIKRHLPEKYHSVLNEMESIRGDLILNETDHCFVRGFVEGYKFLRTLNSSYRGEVLDVRR